MATEEPDGILRFPFGLKLLLGEIKPLLQGVEYVRVPEGLDCLHAQLSLVDTIDLVLQKVEENSRWRSLSRNRFRAFGVPQTAMT